MARRNYTSLIDELMALEEWEERKSEVRKKKEEEKKKKEHQPSRGLTFAEGMIVAYMAQFVVGPLYKVFLVHLGVQ